MIKLLNDLFLIIISDFIFICDSHELTYFCNLNNVKHIEVFPKTKKIPFIFINNQVLTFDNINSLLYFLDFLEKRLLGRLLL